MRQLCLRIYRYEPSGQSAISYLNQRSDRCTRIDIKNSRFARETRPSQSGCEVLSNHKAATREMQDIAKLTLAPDIGQSFIFAALWQAVFKKFAVDIIFHRVGWLKIKKCWKCIHCVLYS